jgi:two-component system invasion response regulator UvrY
MPGSPRILLVESQPLVGIALGDLLRQPPLRAQVAAVADVELALDRLRSQLFDLVVCELSVRTSGARELVSSAAAPGFEMRVVLLAAAEEEQLLLDALNWGAAGFFTKDCSPEEFLAGIESVLHGHYAVGRRLLPGLMARLEMSVRAPSATR